MQKRPKAPNENRFPLRVIAWRPATGEQWYAAAVLAPEWIASGSSDSEAAAAAAAAASPALADEPAATLARLQGEPSRPLPGALFARIALDDAVEVVPHVVPIACDARRERELAARQARLTAGR